MTYHEIRSIPRTVRDDLAMQDAYASVIEEHRRLGTPLIQWEDGKIVRISADEAERRWKAQKNPPGAPK